MSIGIIATWRMALDGVLEGVKILEEGGKVGDAIEKAVCNVEDNPLFHSVGYGGLPNINGEVELDAAYMNGDTLGFGGIMSVKSIKNPIKVARLLSTKNRNCLLASSGAAKFAEEHGFEFKNMLYKMAKKKWLEDLPKKMDEEILEAYDGHDTVCVLGRDKDGSMGLGVSTSGLFMKKPGRVGDSPIIGSGFYVDSETGGAAATGVGEDIMKGCLSYEITRQMRDGKSPQEACEEALKNHIETLKRRKESIGSISVIAMNPRGEWGAATNKKEFSFVVGKNINDIIVYIARNDEGKITISEASREWLEKYNQDLIKGSGV